MASDSNIAAVICHGSYHTPAPYAPLIEALKARGIEAYCPQLPTSDLAKLNVGDVKNPDFDREPPEGGYPAGDEDTAAVLEVLEPLINVRGKKVILVGHSSGGWVATQSARQDLQAKWRQETGLDGGVIGIFYMGAIVVPVGESIHSFFQPKDGTFYTPPYMEFHKHGGAGLGTLVQAEKYLFNDLDVAEAQKWAATLTASPIMPSKLTNDAYSALPCAYLVLEGDMMLPKEYQEGMIALQAQKTGEFTVYRCPAGHSPHLSWTKGVVDTVQDFLGKIGA
ncbi:Alpha/beta hydrolase fold-1 [Hypoxylon sp. FL0543]|nr:Alpha/beta hydrolase fold-1 [Hypoxylon sp. FL0543]